ncbi:GTPase-activating protein CdGAPr isoform X3 [Periplaneta americana]|uniref:GTPase-activating protein CdGAPr isoform X3 n=1 Tax=Periplaneta americana TaxID=6978 RepID=UPI0037E909B2
MRRVLSGCRDAAWDCYGSGLCAATEMESSRGGSIRIQHLTAAATSGSPSDGRSRFPKLDECAHFHYEQVELGPFQVCLYDEELKPLACEDSENKWWHVAVTSQGKSWVLRRSYENFRMLDQQLHRCIYDRKFSGLQELPPEDNVPGENQEESIRRLLTEYLSRFSQIAGNLINCGPVLNWLELDNRGRRLLVPDGDNCPINTPAVAAAYSVKRYTAQAGDEISFEVGDMISVIDMPPPEESVWWRGKRGFQVGFFPCECVAVIGDKVPRNLQLPAHLAQQPTPEQPSKPVLRKHGKLIAFFRSFILSRPSRRRLKQSGILKERVFGCDLGEHLLNSGHEIPMVLKCCAEFIETHGIVDGIYRLSGVTSNIQKLRNAFDEDRVPALYEDEAILQDIHSVASLLKMYFRELPNPLCTYQLYHTFVNAVQSSQEEGYRLLRMRDAVQKLPPPHYRTLEYLMRHLARVAERGHLTGMTPRNVAIVWAPNLLRCKELEVGGVAALQGVGVQAVVTEFLVCYTDLIFCDGLPPLSNLPQPQVTPKRSRPKSLAISTPTKLLSLEEARTRALLSSSKVDQEYIEVGGGPANLPAKYHTVIELPGSGRKRSGTSSKRSPLGWKSFFSKSGRKSSGPQPRKASTPSDLGLSQEKAVTESELAQGRRRLRPVKSAESLASGANSCRNSAALDLESQPSTEQNSDPDTLSPGPASNKSSGHSRSVSHDSYFDHLAETPVHTHPVVRPSKLPEEDTEDHFSSSLDLSEIQLNFDLEESEMRIFSEDETLVSTSVGSGSIMSQASPHMGSAFRVRHQMVCSKRVPVPRARPEDPLSGCPSADPSPKKQKTCAAPISPQGSTRSKRSRLEEQLACSAAELRYIDSQSPENQQQLLVQAEVHPHHQYVNIPDSKSTSLVSPSSGVLESPPNTATTISAHTNNTSPSLAEATVSDNESFTLHSSGLPTPDTPLLMYTPLLDDETCSTSSTTNTPDYDLKLTPSPSTKYHRLGAPSLSPSPTPTPRLTPNLDGENSYENMLTKFGGARYENVPAPDMNSHNTKYMQEDKESDGEASPRLTESQITIRYENVVSPASSRGEEAVVYEPITSEVDDSVTYEPVNISQHEEDCSGMEPVQLVYQNVPNNHEEEEHVYEDVQLDTVLPRNGEVKNEVQSTDDVEVYQQVKYFRRSIHEVNQLLGEPGSEMADSVDDTLEPLSQEEVSAVQDYSLPCSGEGEGERDEGEGENSEAGAGDSTTQSCEEGDQSCDSVIHGSLVVQIKRSERRTSSERSDLEDSLVCSSTESPQSSPEHRKLPNLDPNPNRRKFESEIGRDILRERRMKQELEEMRIANQGGDGVPLKQSSKCNVRELLSKFETSPTQSDEQRFSFPEENLDMSINSVTPTLGRKLVTLDTKPSRVYVSVSPNLVRKETATTPKPSRRSDPSPHCNSTSLPPCVRARLAKAARNKLANSTALSVSLDEGQFLSSSGEDSGQLVRVQTSPDINDTRESKELTVESEREKTKSATEVGVATLEKSITLAGTGLDDPQRRERIERYKEERRLFLREKYRSESFRGERDEILQRLKQKAGKSVSSPTEEPMDMSRSLVTGSDRVRSNSFRSTGDERERDIMSQSLPSSDRLSGTLERTRERRFGRRSASPKDRDSELSATSLRGSDDVESSRHRRSSTSDKQKFNGSSSSPEKSPITCVTVRQRLGSDRMTVNMGPTVKPLAVESDKVITRASRVQLENISKPSVLRTAKGHIGETEPEQAATSERLTRPADNHLTRKKSTDKGEVSQEHPTVEIRLSSRGKLGDTDRRPASIPARSPEHRITNDSPRRRSSADCPGRQTSPSYCIRDMAALFENRRDPPNQPPPRPAPAGKQYLSSV